MTPDLESRLRSTLTSAEAIVEGSYVVEPVRSHIGLGRVAGAMAVVVGLVAGGYAWKTHNQGPTTIHYAEGNWTTPADNVLAIDWNREPFDAEIGATYGGLANVMSYYRQGCPPMADFAFEVRASAGGRSSTHRELVEKYGDFGFTDPKLLNRSFDVPPCTPHGPIPEEVLQLGRDRASLLTEFMRIRATFGQEVQACTDQHPELESGLDRLGNAFNANQEAMKNGTYEGLAEMQSLERQLALGAYRCEAEPYLRRRAAEKPIVDAYLAVPENRARLERVKVIVKEIGLSVEPAG
jgi:hypothetical protein